MRSNFKLFSFFAVFGFSVALASSPSIAQTKIIPFYADEKLALDWVSGNEEFKEKGDQVWFTFMIQAQDKTDKTVEIMKLSISVNECVKGNGRFKILDTKNKFIDDSDFIIGGASVGSAVAKFACDVVIDSLKDAANSKK